MTVDNKGFRTLTGNDKIMVVSSIGAEQTKPFELDSVLEVTQKVGKNENNCEFSASFE